MTTPPVKEGAKDLKGLIKEMSKYIKAHHHLKRLQSENTGKSITSSRQRHHLQPTVQQANLTTNILQLIQQNDQKWLKDGSQIMEQHYTEQIKDLGSNIKQIYKGSWRSAWETAIRWAKIDVAHIKDETINEASVAIEKLLSPITQKENQSPIQPEPANTDQTQNQDSDTESFPSQNMEHNQSAVAHGLSEITQSEADDMELTQSIVEKDIPDFTRHEHGGNKIRNWHLEPKRKILIIGDSNLQNLPQVWHGDIQVDCYPGATFYHAIHLLKHNTPTTESVQNVILSFGINNREHCLPETASKQLQRLVTIAQATFPNAYVQVPMINFSPHLPAQQKMNLKALNRNIVSKTAYIPSLRTIEFVTKRDNVHWTTETGEKMWNNWKEYLN